MAVPATEKRAQFRKLHESGCFVIPNPWDVGSARLLEHLGFKALASSSAGFAWSLARPDNSLTAEQVVAHLKDLCDGSDLPVNADFEGGFSATPDGVAKNCASAVRAGVAALSIEDSTGNKDQPLRPREEAVERIKAARKGIDSEDRSVMLVGRSEGFFVGKPDLKETIERLVAYAEAGADCLYAPGLRTKEDIIAVVKAVAPKPVNVLLHGPGFTVAEMAELGVRRVSIGGAPARLAYAKMFEAAKELAEQGTLNSFAGGISGGELNKIFRGG